MTKEELTLAVIERLKQEYTDADCTLDYDQAWTDGITAFVDVMVFLL